MFDILLAEDSEFSVRDLTRKLRAWDEPHRLTVVRDGQSAIDRLDPGLSVIAPGLPDLVILDVLMPRVDGLEVLAHIRETPGLEDLSVVMLTTSDSPFDMDLAGVLQANDYLVKGADARTICRTVSRNVRRRPAGRFPVIAAGPVADGIRLE